jgi:methylated-DNA-[protein]-cysteine S-methyltransferase
MPAEQPDRLTVSAFPTPIGESLLITDQQGNLRTLDFRDYEPRMRRLLRLQYGKDIALEDGPAPKALLRALTAYFDGDIGALDSIACETAGTPFQRSVWTSLRKIPAGMTTSYGALARRIGRPAAMRAVGAANGANPIAIVVPCHRVIGTDGSLTGYGGGLDRKRWLLQHEGALATS